MEEEEDNQLGYTYIDTSATGDILAGNPNIWTGNYSTVDIEYNTDYDDLKDRMDRMEAKLDKIISMLDYKIDSKTLHVLDELLK